MFADDDCDSDSDSDSDSLAFAFAFAFELDEGSGGAALDDAYHHALMYDRQVDVDSGMFVFGRLLP